MSTAPHSSALTPSLEHLVLNSRAFYKVLRADVLGELPPGYKTLDEVEFAPENSHHWSFLRAYSCSKQHDVQFMSRAALTVERTSGDLKATWDGGAHSRSLWARISDAVINHLNEDELRAQAIHLVTFEPHLFQGNTDDLDVLRAGWRRKADDCFEAVLAHLLGTAHCAAQTGARPVTAWQSLLRRTA